jgi:transaldolase/glucose-6-phosphate isomerase
MIAWRNLQISRKKTGRDLQISMSTLTESYDSAFLPSDVAVSVDRCLAEIDGIRLNERLWAHDATLWQGDPRAIGERLGWLHVCDAMQKHERSLPQFVDEVRQEGFTDAVLLGMGGSSLGAHVIGQVAGTGADHLRLHVLDSTVPGAVHAVAGNVKLDRTLFIVSSKSGGTLEPNLLYEFFGSMVERELGAKDSGRHFIAITDPGTSLAELAGRRGFRRLFLNPTDIGGRFSVLSLFGLVPGALAGVEAGRVLKRARHMVHLCATPSSAAVNPGAWLGAYLVGCLRTGRDKLTFITSPGLGSFGLWAEQLLAESTGKSGKGIVPIVDEPFAPPECYANDRAFAYVRLEGDSNQESDSHARLLAEAGLPCVTFTLRDGVSLGSEFFRWEYATAVVGALLGLNPFDQPDVQSAKEATDRILAEYVSAGALPAIGSRAGDLKELRNLRAPAYLALLAYFHETAGMNSVFSEFRGRTVAARRTATTLGYGPRYLHSTGQLHKGGPDSGFFVMLTARQPEDDLIPGRPYGFGVVSQAQAIGDFRALAQRGRTVLHIELTSEDPLQLRAALGRLASPDPD